MMLLHERDNFYAEYNKNKADMFLFLLISLALIICIAVMSYARDIAYVNSEEPVHDAQLWLDMNNLTGRVVCEKRLRTYQKDVICIVYTSRQTINLYCNKTLGMSGCSSDPGPNVIIDDSTTSNQITSPIAK